MQFLTLFQTYKRYLSMITATTADMVELTNLMASINARERLSLYDRTIVRPAILTNEAGHRRANTLVDISLITSVLHPAPIGSFFKGIVADGVRFAAT